MPKRKTPKKPKRHIVSGPFIVEAAQVVSCSKRFAIGLRPARQLVEPVLAAARRAREKIRDFMPIEGVGATAYRREKTPANHRGFALAKRGALELGQVCQRTLGLKSDPAGRAQFGNFNPEQNTAAFAAWQVTETLGKWFDGRDVQNAIPELPAGLWREFDAAVSVLEKHFPDAEPQTEVTDAKPTAGGQLDAPSPPDPPLDDEEVSILLALREVYPRLLSIVQIAANAVVSDTTVKKRLACLIGHKLIHRPRGERKGAALTERGLKLIDRVSPQSDAH